MAARAKPPGRWAVRQGFSAILLLTLPYVVLWLVAPAHTTYTGVLYNANDTFLYYGQMAYGQHGGWLFRDFFTYRSGPLLPLYSLYSLLGHLVPAWTGPVGLGLAYHLARVGLAAAFLWQAWKLFGDATAWRPVRRVAFLFLLFSSGAGLLQLLIAPLRAVEPPFDLLVTESSTFASLAFAPHFVAVLLGMVVYMRALLTLAEPAAAGRLRHPWAVGAAAALLATTIHPDKLAVLLVATVLLVAAQLRRGRLSPLGAASALGMLLPSVPYVVYGLLLTSAHPELHAVAVNGTRDNPVPDPLTYYGMGYGLPLVFALANLPRLVRLRLRVSTGELLMWSFVVAGVLLLVVPSREVGHRAEGLHLALAFLAGRGVVLELMPRLWRRPGFRRVGRRALLGYSRRRLRVLTLNVAVILSSTSVLGLAFAGPRAALGTLPEAYVTADDTAVTAWLRTHAGVDDIAVGEGTSAQFLVAYAGVRVAWGSFAYTPDYDREGVLLADFYLGRTDPRSYLSERHVRWLYFGPREKHYARLRPQDLDFLRPAYGHGDTSIYEVMQGPATAARGPG